MNIQYIFYFLSALTIISASLVITSRHPIRSVLFLVLTFFCISAHYVLLNAQFLALVNIVVYAGAIMVLFLFVIMFLNLNRDIETKQSLVPMFAAVISGGCIFLMVISALGNSLPQTAQPLDNNIGLVESIGMKLYQDYLIPMEISSVLFLVAMIGVVLLNRKEPIQTKTINTTV
ncbi:MAG TPA: NADH-quinone oxidoreductase subunit J [Saprospiraceae bacterium]|nr:NADH-quinone oxidoreductase subunit J [Saprospiraceae bacterium]